VLVSDRYNKYIKLRHHDETTDFMNNFVLFLTKVLCFRLYYRKYMFARIISAFYVVYSKIACDCKLIRPTESEGILVTIINYQLWHY